VRPLPWTLKRAGLSGPAFFVGSRGTARLQKCGDAPTLLVGQRSKVADDAFDALCKDFGGEVAASRRAAPGR